jgi:indole-3-glycerol phosphate synthase
MTLLDDLVAHARARASRLPLLPADAPPPRPSLARAVAGRDQVSVIAEWKRRSPSAGVLAGARSLEHGIQAYRDGGAAAISVLTEDSQFGGAFEDLRAAAGLVDLPILMKDFVVSPAQVAVARHFGASAVLLIARILPHGQLEELAAACRARGLDALIECHDEVDLERALAVDGAVIGINNRDLATLLIDRSLALRLLPRVPADRVAVAESGYDDPAQIRELRGLADAVLVGTALMRSGDARRFLAEAER